MNVCPECHGTGKVLVVSQDPATGEWTHFIEARCGECPVAKTDRHPGQSMYTAPLVAALADGPKTVAELAKILGVKAGCFDYALEMGQFRRVDPSARTGPWMLADTCPDSLSTRLG